MTIWSRQSHCFTGEKADVMMLLCRFVTFDGIAKACAKAAGAPEPELVHYNPKDFDFGKKKAFPMRDQHFFASVDKVRPRVLCAASSRAARKMTHYDQQKYCSHFNLVFPHGCVV